MTRCVDDRVLLRTESCVTRKLHSRLGSICLGAVIIFVCEHALVQVSSSVSGTASPDSCRNHVPGAFATAPSASPHALDSAVPNLRFASLRCIEPCEPSPSGRFSLCLTAADPSTARSFRHGVSEPLSVSFCTRHTHCVGAMLGGRDLRMDCRAHVRHHS